MFLFDEPLSNLDAKLRVQMRAEISKLHQRLGATMIYVTHDQTEAMTMADTIVLMKDGIVQQIDTPFETYNRPRNKFVAGFIGSPAMNFFEGVVDKRGGLIFKEKGDGVTLSINQMHSRKLKPHVGKEVILGLRPEHIFDRAAFKGVGAKAKVDVVVLEPMGNEVYVHFSSSSNKCQYVARVAPSSKLKIGKSLELAIDMSKAQFFDPQTTMVI